MFKQQKIRDTFKNAFNGICYVFSTQRNMKIHSTAALIVVLSGILCNLTKLEWVAVVISITLVIASEIFNTAVETAVDLYTDTFHPLAKIAKDTAAGAVLFCSFCAIIVGILIFMPYIIGFLH